MRTRLAVLLSLAALCAPASAAPEATVKRALLPAAAEWVPGELIVQFESDASVAERRAVHAERGADVKKRIQNFRVDVVKLPHGISVPEAVAAYRADPAVALAEPNYIRYANAAPADPDFGALWALDNEGLSHPATSSDPDAQASGKAGADIDAPAAWDTPSVLGVEPVVAVIDAGFNTSHEDLAGSLWTNPLELDNDVDDTDANTHVDDIHGWDFGERDASLASSYDWRSTRHGTHVAGTIAAGWDNGTGIAGVCRACKVMLLKIENANGQMTISAELAALAYAEENGASVVNMSFGGAFWSAAERAAIKSANMLVVVAAGNESLDNDMYLGHDRNGDRLPDVFSPSYPASYTLPNIVSVAASNHRDEYAYGTLCFQRTGSRKKCAFTNWGHDSVDLAAPGVDVYSTTLGTSGYRALDGTSMAAPHVAGVAALLESQDPLLTTLDLKNKIMNSVEPGALGGLASQLFGWRSGKFTRTSGRLDAAAAFTASNANATPASDGNIGGARSIRTTRKSSVSFPGDVNDVYKKKLYAGKKYRIRLNGPNNRDFDLYLWQRYTKEIWQTNVGCPTYQCPRVSAGRTADEVITFTPKKTGTYFIHVSAWLRSSGWYTLSVRRA
ncbi:MAG: S8 family serine peptidase [Actinobacteria bacterium]|nr:S8 family serine peptidase [Actinomycetota bacterium]